MLGYRGLVRQIEALCGELARDLTGLKKKKPASKGGEEVRA